MLDDLERAGDECGAGVDGSGGSAHTWDGGAVDGDGFDGECPVEGLGAGDELDLARV